jgi:hypothetical protein
LSEGPPIRAFTTLDCHSKLRVHYRLPVPVTLELLAGFRGCELTVNEFSRIVAGAKDHFILGHATMRACGVIGEVKIVATFAKIPGAPAEEARALFERQLGSALKAPLEYHAARNDVV